MPGLLRWPRPALGDREPDDGVSHQREGEQGLDEEPAFHADLRLPAPPPPGVARACGEGTDDFTFSYGGRARL